MKYIVHKDNVSFWINACDKGIHIALEKLDNEIQYLQECVALNKKSPSHLVDISKYYSLPNIKEYLQNVDGVDVDIELDPRTQQYILDCAESFEEYILGYDKGKDKVRQ